LETAEELGLRRGVSVCLNNMGIVYARTGHFQEAITHYQRALAIDRELGIKEGYANNIGNLGNVYRKMGRFEEAEQCYREALAIALELGHQEGIARQQLNSAALLKDRQEWPAALDAYSESIESYRQFDDPYSLSAALILKAEVCLELGQQEEAAALNQEGLALAESVQRKDYTFNGRVQRAQLAAANGNNQAARQQLREMFDCATETAEVARLHDELWQIGAGETHRQAAIELYQELSEKTPDITYTNRLAALSSVAGGSEE
jgi:tetratricopeptide (TPR) repeat protein